MFTTIAIVSMAVFSIPDGCIDFDARQQICQACADGYYLSSGACYRCSDGCMACASAGCIQCRQSYRLDYKHCLPCSFACRSCTADECLECLTGTILLQNHTCRKIVEDGHLIMLYIIIAIVVFVTIIAICTVIMCSQHAHHQIDNIVDMDRHRDTADSSILLPGNYANKSIKTIHANHQESPMTLSHQDDKKCRSCE